MRWIGLVIALGVGCLATAPASAVTVHFRNITGNSAVNAQIGQDQVTAEVTQQGGQALFTFLNSGPEASSVTDVYFDDDAMVLDAISSIINQAGVVFSTGAVPGELPDGGNETPPFVSDFSASSDPPPTHNGVNPGESVGILFDLSGVSFADVEAALGSGLLRIGLRVQAFDTGGSGEAFVSTAPTPEPGTMLGLATFGLVAMSFHRMRARHAPTA